MELMQNVSWVILAASLAGAIFNIKKKRVCFYIWACTNFSWMVIDLYYHIWAQGVLFGIYFCLAIWGIFAWREKGINKEARL